MQAIEIYKNHKYHPGQLEAFNVLIQLQKILKPENIWITADEILHNSENANTLLQLFLKDPQKLLPNELKFVKQAMEFHHVQKLLHKQYLLPPYLGYWIDASELQVKLATETIYRMLSDHYKELAKPWLTLETIKIVLSSASATGFNIHHALKQSSLIPYSQRNYFKNYVETLSSIIELEYCYKSTETLLDIYTPLRAINNQAMHREDFSLLQTLAAVHKTFERKCKILLATPNDLVTSLDKLFLAWRVSTIASRNIGDLQKLLHRHATDHFKYVHGHGTRHIFLPWIDLCAAIAVSSELRLVTACSHVWHGIFCGTLRHQQVRESISDINLIYIIMVQTIILLGLASYAWGQKFYLPQIYRHIITTFNVQSDKPRSLLTACKKESTLLENSSWAICLIVITKILKISSGLLHFNNTDPYRVVMNM